MRGQTRVYFWMLSIKNKARLTGTSIAYTQLNDGRKSEGGESSAVMYTYRVRSSVVPFKKPSGSSVKWFLLRILEK